MSETLQEAVAEHWAESPHASSPEKNWESWRDEHRVTIPAAVSIIGAKSVHEIGCGAGPNLRLLLEAAPELQVSGSDIREAYIAWAQEKGLSVALKALPAEIKGYDATLSCYVMAYLDPESAFRQLRLIQTPWLILIEPESPQNQTLMRYSNITVPRWYHNWSFLMGHAGWQLQWRWPIANRDCLSSLLIAAKLIAAR